MSKMAKKTAKPDHWIYGSRVISKKVREHVRAHEADRAALTADVLCAAPPPAIPPSSSHFSHIPHPVAHLTGFVNLLHAWHGIHGLSFQEDFSPCIMPACRGIGAFKREAHVFCGRRNDGLGTSGDRARDCGQRGGVRGKVGLEVSGCLRIGGPENIAEEAVDKHGRDEVLRDNRPLEKAPYETRSGSGSRIIGIRGHTPCSLTSHEMYWGERDCPWFWASPRNECQPLTAFMISVHGERSISGHAPFDGRKSLTGLEKYKAKLRVAVRARAA